MHLLLWLPKEGDEERLNQLQPKQPFKDDSLPPCALEGEKEGLEATWLFQIDWDWTKFESISQKLSNVHVPLSM